MIEGQGTRRPDTNQGLTKLPPSLWPGCHCDPCRAGEDTGVVGITVAPRWHSWDSEHGHLSQEAGIT